MSTRTLPRQPSTAAEELLGSIRSVRSAGVAYSALAAAFPGDFEPIRGIRSSASGRGGPRVSQLRVGKPDPGLTSPVPGLRLQQHLDCAVLLLLEDLVGLRGLVERQRDGWRSLRRRADRRRSASGMRSSTQRLRWPGPCAAGSACRTGSSSAADRPFRRRRRLTEIVPPRRTSSMAEVQGAQRGRRRPSASASRRRRRAAARSSAGRACRPARPVRLHADGVDHASRGRARRSPRGRRRRGRRRGS